MNLQLTLFQTIEQSCCKIFAISRKSSAEKVESGFSSISAGVLENDLPDLWEETFLEHDCEAGLSDDDLAFLVEELSLNEPFLEFLSSVVMLLLLFLWSQLALLSAPQVFSPPLTPPPPLSLLPPELPMFQESFAPVPLLLPDVSQPALLPDVSQPSLLPDDSQVLLLPDVSQLFPPLLLLLSLLPDVSQLVPLPPLLLPDMSQLLLLLFVPPLSSGVEPWLAYSSFFSFSFFSSGS